MLRSLYGRTVVRRHRITANHANNATSYFADARAVRPYKWRYTPTATTTQQVKAYQAPSLREGWGGCQVLLERGFDMIVVGVRCFIMFFSLPS